MSSDRPTPKALADDIHSNGSKVVEHSGDVAARAALLRDSQSLSGSTPADANYRTQVQQALKDQGVPTVENRGSLPLGISIYSPSDQGQIEVVKGLPGEHALTADHSDIGAGSPPKMPNYREALAFSNDVTIWENDKDITNNK
jgi:hypothetical protein